MNTKRVPLIAGNWKMHTSIAEGLRLTESVCSATSSTIVDVAILPPFTNLSAVKTAIAQQRILLAAQDIFWEDEGAYTGEVSAFALEGLCDFVLIGHSERRRIRQETDEQIAKKAICALRRNLPIMLAVGESLAEHEAGQTNQIITRQCAIALRGLNEAQLLGCSIAYEPVWAISTNGSGKKANAADAQASCALIREFIAQQFSSSTAEQMRILYGGSVTSSNAAEFFAERDIDGVLVGKASLQAGDFVGIVDAAQRQYQSILANPSAIG